MSNKELTERIEQMKLEISMLITAVNYLHKVLEEMRIKQAKINLINGIRV